MGAEDADPEEEAAQPDDRPAEEVQAWLREDPIDRLVDSLGNQQGQLTDAELAAMDAEVRASIEAAVAFAESSPFRVISWWCISRSAETSASIRSQHIPFIRRCMCSSSPIGTPS